MGKHKYFNTNNLWINLSALKSRWTRTTSAALPVLKNSKTVDPRDKKNPGVGLHLQESVVLWDGRRKAAPSCTSPTHTPAPTGCCSSRPPWAPPSRRLRAPVRS